ncbi:MAG: hypothetical protein RIB98_03760 [Acidimicrobiales bacterium]
MLERTRQLWEKQRQSVGDRQGLFGVVADAIDASTVLYAGSYVDLTPSLLWPSVTSVDTDRRAARFFADTEGITELLDEMRPGAGRHSVRFIHDDYSNDLDLGENSVDLLISLYAGFVSEHCTRYLRPGGFLLVNPSHGDAAMASIDDRYQIHGAVLENRGDFTLQTRDLDEHLVPRKDVEITVESLHGLGRGVPYTTPAFAYLFRRV